MMLRLDDVVVVFSVVVDIQYVHIHAYTIHIHISEYTCLVADSGTVASQPLFSTLLLLLPRHALPTRLASHFFSISNGFLT